MPQEIADHHLLSISRRFFKRPHCERALIKWSSALGEPHEFMPRHVETNRKLNAHLITTANPCWLGAHAAGTGEVAAELCLLACGLFQIQIRGPNFFLKGTLPLRCILFFQQQSARSQRRDNYAP
jgi:hypothetical protein